MSENIPIFLSSGNDFCPFVATAIASICDTTSSFVDFYVIGTGITDENKSKIENLRKKFQNFSVEFIEIDEDEVYKDLEYYNSVTYINSPPVATYNRFLIPQLKPELKKVLYLDSDIVVLGDIKQLFDIDLEGYALGAVPTVWPNLLIKKELSISDEHKYFGAGVMLIDNQKWGQMNITKLAFETEKKYRDKLLMADQDVANIMFDNNYKILPHRFNYDMHTAFNFNNDDVVIRHFSGVKPWKLMEGTKTNLMPNIEDYWRYARMTDFYGIIKSMSPSAAENAHQLRQLQVLKMECTRGISRSVKFKKETHV